MALSNVIVGIDGTRAAFEAARQAARLVEPDGRLLLVGVEDGWDALAGRWAGTTFARSGDETEWTYEARQEDLRRRIESSLMQAASQLSALCAVDSRRVEGRSWEALRAVAAEERADLMAVGTHGGSRIRGIVLGYTATHLAHEAPCSLLIARPPFDPSSFPASLAVGYDGSPPSERALDLAIRIAGRRAGISTRVVTCRPVPPGLARDAAIRRSPSHFTFDDERLLADDGLVEASYAADLLLIGSRGLQGVAALGSTSERVVHQAASSVLVVR